jgi:hypothetical protein
MLESERRSVKLPAVRGEIMPVENEQMEKAVRVVLGVATRKAESQLALAAPTTRIVRARVLHELIVHFLSNVPDAEMRERAISAARANAELDLANIRREENDAKLFEAERTGKYNVGRILAAS